MGGGSRGAAFIDLDIGGNVVTMQILTGFFFLLWEKIKKNFSDIIDGLTFSEGL